MNYLTKRNDLEDGKKDARFYQWVTTPKGHYKDVNKVLLTNLRKRNVKDLPIFVTQLRGFIFELIEECYVTSEFIAVGGKKIQWMNATLPQILSHFGSIQTAVGKRAASEYEQTGEVIVMFDKGLVFACNNLKVVWDYIFNNLEKRVAESLVAQGIPHIELGTINKEVRTINKELGTINYQQSTINNELPTVNFEEPTDEQEVQLEEITPEERIRLLGLMLNK